MIAMFSTRGREPSGMKLYNPDMAEALRSIFNLAWQKSEDYDSPKKKK